MVRTHVEPQVFRKEWLAVPTSDTDFSCIVEAGGRVVAMGFLDVVDGVGQAGMPKMTEGVIGYIVAPDAARNADNHASVRVLERAGMRRERHSIEALWHEELGWIDEYQYAALETRNRRQRAPVVSPR